jgi:membrane protease subunit (stomatin/prohibitin family)
MTSPLRAEVYFVNMKVFPDFRWGTRDPVAFKDSQLGLIRLRAFGMFNIRVLQPVLFVNTIVGTQGCFTTAQIEEYLSRVVVSRLNDYLGANLDSFMNLPGRYDEIAAGLTQTLQEDFGHFGLGLQGLYVESITPPADVQQAIDDKSRLALFDDVNKLLKVKAAMAMETAAANQGEAGAGMGMGVGLMMPALYGGMLQQAGQAQAADTAPCPDCKNPIPRDSRFCPLCGHQQLVFQQCGRCGKNLPPSARFCPKCGAPAGEKPAARFCGKCRAENLASSVFCNQCGEKL